MTSKEAIIRIAEILTEVDWEKETGSKFHAGMNVMWNGNWDEVSR